MRVVYTPKHWLHNPRHEVQVGTSVPNFEVPRRAEAIRDALAQDGGFVFGEHTEHGADPISAVHDMGMLRYLENAWRDWRAVNPGTEAMVGDTFLHPALREGMSPPAEPASPIARLGYWCFETMTPIVPGTYAAARAAVDVALTAADCVLAGERSAYALCRPPGHHSPRGAFGGYCFFNNAAIAAAYLGRLSGDRVAILDIDYHAGNGTQQIFYSREDVLYVSIHGHPDRAYPYFVGYPDETGVGAGEGTTLNVCLPSGTSDAEYLEALDRALTRVANFGGSHVVVSFGSDTFGQDPICDFALTTPVYHAIGARIAALNRPMVILQEGGYYLPALGENARQFLRGVEGRALEYAPPPIA